MSKRKIAIAVWLGILVCMGSAVFLFASTLTDGYTIIVHNGTDEKIDGLSISYFQSPQEYPIPSLG
ncbi:hypothetical protein GTO89_07505 [Heliobacterium gestii]|uniref:Uncharacterized protein n=1 Tax=Heliomicrobium gestii TaxID=2699 RepID=A0A845LEL1_HELGE|nr:hypothetical protein [Heliomicrobium gestii]MBM7866329.1 hypothetical protein [Heliomicrobium gestii]MZP42885.1 hypothetical protein [Heliomicrobium gestii]